MESRLKTLKMGPDALLFDPGPASARGEGDPPALKLEDQERRENLLLSKPPAGSARAEPAARIGSSNRIEFGKQMPE